jgi:type I restriction enzyme, S subunit
MELKPGYKLTEVGVIPEDWVVSYVGESFEVCNELRFPISQSVRERMSGPYPYYGPTNVQGWINEYRVEGKYALIGEDGDHFLKWRTQAMTLLVSGQFNVNNHAHLVCGRENLTEWFYWFFSNRDLIPYLTRQGASRYKLKKATLIKMPCALPPISEQRSIATALSDMDELLGGLDRLITKKRDLKQSAMQQLLTGKTRLPEFVDKKGYKQTELGVIPNDWDLVLLSELASDIGDGIHSTPAYSNNADYYFVNGNNLFNGKVTLDLDTKKVDSLEFKKHRKNLSDRSILMSINGTIGNLAYYQYEPIILGKSAAYINIKIEFSKKFIYFSLQAEGVKQILEDGLTGTTIRNLGLATIRNTHLPIPKSYEEQTAIASILSDMDTEIATLEQRRNKTRDLKQAMMQELLTGRIRLL